MRGSLAHGVEAFVFLSTQEPGDIGRDILRNGRSGRKSGRLYAGNVVDILSFSAGLDYEVLFV